MSALSGRSAIGPETTLTNCQGVINLFHPYDPLASRLDHLVCTEPFEPEQIEHHQGRKRIHLGMARCLLLAHTIDSFQS